MAAEAGRARRSPLGVVALLLAAAVMLAPLVWTLLLSLKANAALVGNSGAALSPPYTLENYASLLQGNQVFRWLINSVIVSGGTTLGVLALCSLAGYGFARLDFPFRRTLFVFVLLGLAIPEQAVILSQHQLFADLRLHNSYGGLILPGLAGPFGVFFMTQYFRAIPKDLDEAAMLDLEGLDPSLPHSPQENELSDSETNPAESQSFDGTAMVWAIVCTYERGALVGCGLLGW